MPIARRRRPTTDTTFLQYVCERLLGSPERRGVAGESYWCCPFHNDTHPSFHTLPSKPGYKERWCCFGCGMRGDEADLMREVMPGEGWDRRRARLVEWRQDYDRECEAAVSSVILPGTGSGRELQNAQVDHAAKLAENAWFDKLTDAERELLIVLKERVGSEVSLDLLARVGRRYREWFVASEAQHRAECRDADCGCRLARGLSPLNREVKQTCQ